MRKSCLKVDEYYRVVYDPIPYEVGGFGPGTRLSKTEVMFMMHVRTFALETILLDSRGNRYIVRQNGGRFDRQILVPYQGPGCLSHGRGERA